ncbi:MAG TPA: ParA family protein [Caldimonas sp.]|jgi:chromosome partitioning protein|nr:ParA family protein [Caldimonas sp.]HEX4234841.1 ParA family protein [Caldimonas sp.]
MPVIAVVNRKGGSGKSTLATQLAAYYANAGVPVMLGDVDRQQSTQSWLRSRSLRELPRSAPIVGWAVDPKRVLRPPAGVTHVVLDTPGGLRGFDLARVVAFADVILMPICNSIFDRESAGECFAEMTALPRVASGRCKVAAVGMRLDARTKGAEVLASWASDLKLPFIGVIREAQAYVRCVEQGLTVFDLADAQAQVDVAQWQPIVAWLEPVLRKVWRPELRGNPSVVRTTSGVDISLADDEHGRALVIAEGDELVAERVSDAGLTRADARPVDERPRSSGSEPPRPAPLRLGGLLSWLTTPRFLHRNS